MARIARFNDTDDKLLEYNESADTSQYSGVPHTLINPSLAQVTNVAQKYWKLSGGQIVSKTAQEISDQNAAEAAAILAGNRNAAKAHMTNASDIDWRTVAALLVDEVNILRQWLASFKVEVAAATTLADLKTRVAGLPATPDRTLTQAKTAYETKVDSGAAD
jgi:hypothetical protein